MDSDLDLLDRWRAGDSGSGNELFKRYFDRMWRFFDTKVTGDVDELVQATFLACVRSRDSFRKQSSFRTYLYTIARNELYRHLSRRRRRAGVVEFGVTSLADLGTTPPSKLARNQEQKILLQALYRLPVEKQLLLELHYWEEMTPSELAEVFGTPASTMRTRLQRAREALRAAMETMAHQPDRTLEVGQDLDTWARSIRAQWSNHCKNG